MGGRDHRVAGHRGLQRRRAHGPRPGREHPEWVFLYQYGNPANPKAHYEGTGPEIFRDCPGITHFVAGLGTSGTLLGVGRFLREKLGEAVQIWAVEPPAGEMVDGLRNLDDGYIPPIFENLDGAELLDRKTVVRPGSHRVDAALDRGGDLRRHLDGGGPGRRGQCAMSFPEGEEASIVVVSADGGWKYLSTGAWTDDLDEVTERAKTIIYF